MTEHSHLEPNSHLSALMDGEVDEFELRRTLDRVGQDSALRDKWRRYHLAASALRKEPARRYASASAKRWRIAAKL